MRILYQVIHGTPSWVWAVFIYLMIVGVQALKTRTVSIYRVASMPIIFMIFSLGSMIENRIGLEMFAWVFAFSIGSMIGAVLIDRKHISIDKHKMITLQGSIVPLVLMLSLFSIKYAFGILYALYPALESNMLLLMCYRASAALVVGISWGRYSRIQRIYQKALSV